MVPDTARLLLTVAAIRTIEAALLPHTPLMARAGAALAGRLRPYTSAGRPILFLCGPGNNGGDGLVAARLLHEEGFSPRVVALPSTDRTPADAAAAWQAWAAANGEWFPDPTVVWSGAPPEGLVIVDACFGIGLTRDIGEPYRHWIAWANAQPAYRIAVDLPSGLDADSGNRIGKTLFCAHETLTFLSDKPGLHTAEGPDCAGEVRVATLGIDEVLASWQEEANTPFWLPQPAVTQERPEAVRRAQRSFAEAGLLLAPELFSRWLTPRRHNVHKGHFGHAAVIGGAAGMSGALHLAARAALALGVGKISALSVNAASSRFDPLAPEVMWPSTLPKDATAIAVGPGLGQTSDALAWLERAVSEPRPLVLDADALNLLAAAPVLARRVVERVPPTVLTPHPGEAAQLLGTTTVEIQRHRLAAATTLAERFQAVVILKGCGAVIAAPTGRWAINPSGHGGMASGGMGDTLTGLLVALLAQGWPPFPAAAFAALLHGAAAEALSDEGVGPVGLTASETIAAARQLLNRWCRGAAPRVPPALPPSGTLSSP